MYAYSQLGVTIVIYLKYLVIVSWFDFASLYNTMDSVPNSYIFETFSYCVSVWICQSLRHNGQCARFCVPVHLTMQWRWKGWEHAPHTNGQSSPGYLHSVQQPSKGNLQIAHNSSFASHVHEATACHWRTFTFILIPPRSASTATVHCPLLPEAAHGPRWASCPRSKLKLPTAMPPRTMRIAFHLCFKQWYLPLRFRVF